MKIIVTDENRSNIILELSLRMKEVSGDMNSYIYIEKTYKDYIIDNLPGNSNSQIQYLYNKMTGENYTNGNHGWDYK